LLNLIYVGRVVRRQKRFDRLVEIAHAASSRGIDLRIKVYGECHDRFKSLPPSIIIRGFINSWGLEVSSNDIMLITSDYEGLPLSLLDFHKAGGRRVLAFRAAWAEALFHGSSLFSSTSEALHKLQMPESLRYEEKMLSKYFDKDRFTRSVAHAKSFIER